MKAPKIYWRAHAKAYNCHWQGRQTWLGKDMNEAKANLARLMAGAEVLRPQRHKVTKNTEPTVQEIVDLFLDWVKANRKPLTYRWYVQFLEPFCALHGRLRISQLRKHHVQSWIDSNTAWNNNTAHNGARAIIAAMNWAVKWDRLPKSPLAGFEKARTTARDCYLSPADWKRFLDAVDDDDFRDAIRFLRLTGCRPQEMRYAEKRHFDPSIPAIVFPLSEAKGERTERVIHLAGDALVIVQKRALKFPEGELFRSGNGDPWTKDVLARRFARWAKRLGIKGLSPYTLRHTYGTDALINGQDSLTVAELMGHKSTRMLEVTYQKIRRRRDFMKDAAAKAIENVG